MNMVDIVSNWSLDTCMSRNFPRFNSLILVKFTLTNRDKDTYTYVYVYTYISTYTCTLFIIFLIYIKLCGFDPPLPFLYSKKNFFFIFFFLHTVWI